METIRLTFDRRATLWRYYFYSMMKHDYGRGPIKSDVDGLFAAVV